MKLSLIVPCYNEAKNIPLILEKFASIIKRQDIEVLLVNNGSTDNSQEILNKLVSNYSFARVIEVEVNQGYGFGITSGLCEAKGEFLGYTHADMQTDPTDTIKALDIIEAHPDPKNCFLKGDRKGRPIFDEFFTIGMSIFEYVYLGIKLWDINAQPNIFHRNFFDKIRYNCPKDFSLDLYLFYIEKKKKLNIIRFDVNFLKRIYGSSNWNKGLVSKLKFIKRTIEFSMKLKKEH